MFKTSVLTAAVGAFAVANSANAALVAYFPVDSATDSSTFLNDTIDDPTHAVEDGTTTNTNASIIFDATRGGDVLSTVEGHRYRAGDQDIDLADGFTWSLWANVNSSNSTDPGADVLIGTRNGGTWHKIDREGISNWNGTELTYTDISNDTWTHYLYTGDSTGRSFWINGVKVDEDLSVATSTFTGQMEIGGSSRFSEDVTALIDDVAIWNERLSDEDIVALANGADPTNIPEPGSLALLGLGGLLIGARRRRG